VLVGNRPIASQRGRPLVHDRGEVARRPLLERDPTQRRIDARAPQLVRLRSREESLRVAPGRERFAALTPVGAAVTGAVPLRAAFLNVCPVGEMRSFLVERRDKLGTCGRLT
jgi:hypothetical protein